MPKFLDDIKFIDSQGDEHAVSEYNNQIRTQGRFYTGDSHLEEFNGEIPESNISQGEISKQGKTYTGLNADGKGDIQDGIIKQQGDEQNARIIAQGNTQETRIENQGDYYTDTILLEEGNTEDKHSTYKGIIPNQGAYYTGLNVDGTGNEQYGEIYKQGKKWSEAFDSNNLVNRVINLEIFDGNHNNIENGENTDSIVQKYSGKVDDTHYGNANEGESAAVFGEANSNTKNRTLVVGKMNVSNVSNSIISGLGNGRANVTGKDSPGYQLYGTNLIVGGLLNQSKTYNDASGNTKSAENSIISGQSNILNGGNNCLIIGVQNKTYRDLTQPDQNIIAGNNNKVYCQAGLTVGNNNTNKSSGSIVAGSYNEGKTNTLLELGNGTSTRPGNAFEVTTDGIARAFGAPIGDNDLVRKIDVQDGSVLNIKNGEGADNIVQTYSGGEDSTHFGNQDYILGDNEERIYGENAAIFGEANTNSANRALLAGKLNINSGANSIISGLGNGRGIDADPDLAPLTGANLIVGGKKNQNLNNGDDTIISGQSNTNNGAKQSIISGIENTTRSIAAMNGDRVIVGGYRNKNFSADSILSGANNINNSYATFTIGERNVNNSRDSIVAGSYNKGYNDTLLELGNGTASAPSNAFTVYRNGNITVAGNITSPTINSINTEMLRLDREKATKATTLSGYGITDSYTKTEVDNKIDALDYSMSGSTAKTITSITQTNGKISATYGDIAFPVTSVAGRTGAVTLTKSDVDLSNVDNTSDETKKLNFTGSISSGNTGFVKGGDVYTELNNKANETTLEEFREYYERRHSGAVLIPSTVSDSNSVSGNFESSLYEGEMALVVGMVYCRAGGINKYANALCFGISLNDGRTSMIKVIMPDETTQEFTCTISKQGSYLRVTISGPSEKEGSNSKYDILRGGLILF